MSEMRVPLLDLKAQHETLRDEVEPVVRKVIEDQWFILGPEVQGLEADIAAYSGAPRAVGCASGSDAILLACLALGIGPGDEVLTSPYTFFSTGGSVHRLGARPVFADIDPSTYNLDLDRAREAASRCSNLKAIMPVHLFGQAADMDGFVALAEELGVALIEDAAQAIGTKDDSGAPVGTRGRIGCFSFFPSKNLGGYGDGGMITTGDEELADLIAILRVHGMQPKYHHPHVGFNSRLDALQAAVLRVKLRHLDAWHEARRANADDYDGLFAEAGAAPSSVPLGEESGLPLRYPARPASERARHVFNQYVIRVPGEIRDALRARLSERNIGNEVYYPIPLHLQECFSELGGEPGDLPEAEAAAQETVALPIYPELTAEQKAYVAETVVGFLRERAGRGRSATAATA